MDGDGRQSNNETVLKGCDFNGHHLSGSGQMESSEAKEEDYIRCSRCDQQVVGMMYYCPNCSYFAHVDCFDLRETLENHPLHPHATLTLSCCCVESVSDLNCYGCPKKSTTTSYFLGYKCVECPRKLDLKCALSDPKTNKLHCHALEFYHVNEKHQACNRKGDQMVTILIDSVRGKRCAVCELPLTGPVNGCASCDFWIHKGCPDYLEQQIPTSSLGYQHHLLHQADHELIFLPAPPYRNRCGACGTHVLRNTFHCKVCFFDIHHGCAIRKPCLQREHIEELHDHDLTFFPDPAPFFRCHHCQGFSYETPVFRCVACNFTIHKSCVQSIVTQKNLTCLLHKDCLSLQPDAINQEKQAEAPGKLAGTESQVGLSNEDPMKKKITGKIERLQRNIQELYTKIEFEKRMLLLGTPKINLP